MKVSGSAGRRGGGRRGTACGRDAGQWRRKRGLAKNGFTCAIPPARHGVPGPYAGPRRFKSDEQLFINAAASSSETETTSQALRNLHTPRCAPN